MSWIEEAFTIHQKAVADSNLIRKLTFELIDGVYVVINRDVGQINQSYTQTMWGNGANLVANKDTNKIEIKLYKPNSEINVASLSFYATGSFHIDIATYKPGRQTLKLHVELCLRNNQVIPIFNGEELTKEDISKLSLIHFFQFDSPKTLESRT